MNITQAGSYMNSISGMPPSMTMSPSSGANPSLFSMPAGTDSFSSSSPTLSTLGAGSAGSAGSGGIMSGGSALSGLGGSSALGGLGGSSALGGLGGASGLSGLGGSSALGGASSLGGLSGGASGGSGGIMAQIQQLLSSLMSMLSSLMGGQGAQSGQGQSGMPGGSPSPSAGDSSGMPTGGASPSASGSSGTPSPADMSGAGSSGAPSPTDTSGAGGSGQCPSASGGGSGASGAPSGSDPTGGSNGGCPNAGGGQGTSPSGSDNSSGTQSSGNGPQNTGDSKPLQNGQGVAISGGGPNQTILNNKSSKPMKVQILENSKPGEPQKQPQFLTLAPGSKVNLSMPENWAGRINKVNDDPSKPQATLNEVTFNGAGGQTFYDQSVIDGYNGPSTMAPTNGSQSNNGLNATVGSAKDLSQIAPSSMKLGGDVLDGVHPVGDNASNTANQSFYQQNLGGQAYNFPKDDQAATRITNDNSITMNFF